MSLHAFVGYQAGIKKYKEAPATTPDMALALADAVQCPNCTEGWISTEPHGLEPLECTVCWGSGRLDGKALEAAAKAFEAAYDGMTMTDELWQAIKDHGDYEDLMRAMRAGADAYLGALQEDTQ